MSSLARVRAMLSKLIKLAVAALVIHAAWRVGSAYWTFYQFEDRLTQIAQFGDQKKDVDLCREAGDAAALLQVPVSLEAVSLKRGGNPAFNCANGFDTRVAGAALPRGKIVLEASYQERLAILPGYERPWTFDARVEVWARPY